MNEQNIPPDELASAFLDDELAESAAGDVRRDPELTARVDELRQASDAVGAPVTPPPGAADAAVEAALADFDARRTTTLEPARQRSRRLSLITGVAAAVAIGFIVAAAVGLFSERDDADLTAAPAPPPAAEAAPAAAPEPAPEPAAESPPPAEPAAPAADLEPADAAAAASAASAEAASASAEAAAAGATARAALHAAEAALAAAELAQATAEGNQEAVSAAEAALAEAQAAADYARAEAAAAQEEADAGRQAASAAQAEASEAVAAPPPPATSLPPAAPPPPAAAEETATGGGQPAADMDDMAADDMAADDMGDMGDMEDIPTDPPPGGCDAAVGDGTVELQITAGETPVLVIRTIDERLVALNGTTCGEIPPEPPDTVYPLPSESCDAAVGDGRVALRIAVGETPVLIIHTIDGRLVGLGGDTCSSIPPTEPG